MLRVVPGESWGQLYAASADVEREILRGACGTEAVSISGIWL